MFFFLSFFFFFFFFFFFRLASSKWLFHDGFRTKQQHFTLSSVAWTVNYCMHDVIMTTSPGIQKLSSCQPQPLSVVKALKSMFARFGIPEIVVSNNGSQYSSQEFTNFAKAYHFCHTTSSPHYPQSNRQAECAVKTVKKLLRYSTDPCLSLLSCCWWEDRFFLICLRQERNWPNSGPISLISWHATMSSRRGRKEILTNGTKLESCLTCQMILRSMWLRMGNPLLVELSDLPMLLGPIHIIDTPSGSIQRNRSQLNAVPDTQSNPSSTAQMTTRSRSPIRTCFRTETRIASPKRLAWEREMWHELWTLTIAHMMSLLHNSV